MKFWVSSEQGSPKNRAGGLVAGHQFLICSQLRHHSGLQGQRFVRFRIGLTARWVLRTTQRNCRKQGFSTCKHREAVPPVRNVSACGCGCGVFPGVQDCSEGSWEESRSPVHGETPRTGSAMSAVRQAAPPARRHQEAHGILRATPGACSISGPDPPLVMNPSVCFLLGCKTKSRLSLDTNDGRLSSRFHKSLTFTCTRLSLSPTASSCKIQNRNTILKPCRTPCPLNSPLQDSRKAVRVWP